NANQVFDMDAGGKNAVAAGTVGSFVVGNPTTFTVNATNDEITDTDGKTSLREALALANTIPLSNDTINFDPTVFATPQTITMTKGEFAVSGTCVINAPAAAKVTLDAGGLSRVINMGGAPTAAPITLSNFTLTNGKRSGGVGTTDAGGGIFISN